MESSRRMNANVKLAGQPCGWCGVALQLGDSAAVCNACESPAHGLCWDQRQGCPRQDCANAPLRQMAVAPPPPMHSGPTCPHCHKPNPLQNTVCVFCGMVTSPDGVYNGPQVNAPGAVAALVWGIVSLFICGIVCGIVAITKSRAAKDAIAHNPMYTGGGMATAGFVLGIIGIIGWALLLIFRLSSM